MFQRVWQILRPSQGASIKGTKCIKKNMIGLHFEPHITTKYVFQVSSDPFIGTMTLSIY